MGVSNLGDLVATATLDISPFANNTNQLKMLVRGLDSQLKIVENSFKGQKNKLEGLKASHTQLGKVLEGNQALFANQARRYQYLKMETGSLNTATKEQKIQLLGAKNAMEATAAKVAELQNKYNALTRDIAVQSSVWTQAGNFLTPLGKNMKKVGDEMASVGKSLTIGLTTPIMTGAGYAVKAAVQYESAFAGVKKTVDETATTSYEKLSNSIRQMSKELPASAAEIANVAEVAGQLGIKADNITDFTKVMIDLGESTNMSATVAAESLAKFANITKLAPENYSRLGASIVELGNNFATTEADITAMASRLAGAGAQIGLSQADIIGLSAALSSVGIEAEMGGSAFSKMMVKMQLAATSGAKGMDELTAKTGLSRRELELMLANSSSKFKKLANSIGMTSTEMGNIVKASANLEDFARISGMTADEFVQKFEKDAVGAIGAFINGLGNAEKSGESAIEMLNEMGFTEVRLRDTLLRAGNAQDLFTKAVNMSNDAWNENTALTDEANKRYETAESKLKMLRNEVTDVAIEFGGPLVDALREGLEAVKPWLKSAADMAKAFSQLDKEQQQQIIKWGLIAAAAGPALNILGNGISVTGSVFKGLGKVSTALGKVSGALKTGAPLMSAFSGATTTATAASGGLASAVGLLGNPVTWGVLLGGAALVGVAMWAEKAREAAQRTAEWGTAVSETEAQELSKFKTKVDETNQAMTAFSENGVQDVEAVKVAFQGLVDEITKLTDKELAKDLKIAEQMGMSPEVIAQIKKSHEQMKSNVQQMSDEVIAIYQRASEQRRQLTEEEKSIVLANQNELIDAQLSLLDYSEKEKLAITKAMNGQLDELNDQQLKKALDVSKKWIEEEDKSYNEHKNNLQEMYDSIKGIDEEAVRARSEIQADLSQLEADHLAKMDAYGQRYAEIRKKMAEQVTFRSDYEEQSYWNVIKKEMEKLGLSYEELMVKSTQASSKIQEGHSMWAQTVADASEETKTANSQWNAMTWDLKEGKLKTNTQEEIQKALQAEGGWENLKFVAKHANLDTNAKIAIGEALEATGQWDSLSPQDKALVVDGQPAIKAIVESKENLAIWNSMPEGVKKLLGENQQFLSSAETAKATLNNWNMLQPTQKDLIANDLASGNAASAQQAINALTGKTVGLNADDLPLLSKVVESNQAVNSLQQTNVPVMNAVDGTGPAVAQAQAGVNSPKQNSPIPMFGLNSTGPAVTQTSASVNSPKQFQPIGMFAQNNTAGPVAQATQAVNSPKQHSPAAIDAVNNASSVAKQATWDLNSIPKTITTTITTFVQKIFKNEKGTNFHPGGLAMVNDQKGPLYKELVTLPSGESFIPEGRNVVLPLPRGSKVLKASDTKKLFPHYADGIGFENTKISSLTKRLGQAMFTSTNNDAGIEKTQTSYSSSNDTAITEALEIAKKALERQIYIMLDGGTLVGEIVDEITQRQNGKIYLDNLTRGVLP